MLSQISSKKPQGGTFPPSWLLKDSAGLFHLGTLFRLLLVLGLFTLLVMMDVHDRLGAHEGRHRREVREYVDNTSPIIHRNFSRRIHLVISFPLYVTGDAADNINNKYIKVGNDLRLLNSRMDEYLLCLNMSLENAHVQHVHLLHDEDKMEDFIYKHFGDHERLSLHKVKAPQITLTLHQYAFENLQNELVMITQADVYMDKGFEYANLHLMRENRLMYALSRHENGSENCPVAPHSNYCVHYIGSHEAYLFVPQDPLPDLAKRMLNHLTFSLGIDNMIVRVYRDVLGYRVLNPCLVMYVYHRHCSKLRALSTVRKRIDVVWDFWTPSSHDLV